MSQLLISKWDIPTFWPLTVNIGDHLVNPYILKAQTFDVRPQFTQQEWAGFERNIGDLSEAAEFPGIEFEPAEFMTTPPASEWDNDKLAALWFGFGLPLLATETFRRIMLWHGTHVTGNGLETFQSSENQPISTARRGELKADVEAERELYRGRLAAALRAYRPTTPSTTCGNNTRRRPGRGGVRTFAV